MAFNKKVIVWKGWDFKISTSQPINGTILLSETVFEVFQYNQAISKTFILYYGTMKHGS